MTKKDLIIVTPNAPPIVCGIWDYSAHIAHHLGPDYKKVIFAVANVHDTNVVTPNASQPIIEYKALANYESTAGADLLLNFTPRSYAKYGLSLKLINVLKNFKKQHPQHRIFIFMHENWSGDPTLKLHHKIMDGLAKWSTLQIGHLSEGIAVINEHEKEKIEAQFKGNLEVKINAVGANVLPENQDLGLQAVRKEGVCIVFGLTHTRLWAIEKNIVLLKHLLQIGWLKELRCIGALDPVYGKQEAAFIKEHLNGEIFSQLGAIPAEEVSKNLLESSLALSGQNANSLIKSGSFAAMAAHAIPVVCDVPKSLKNPPGEALFRPDELLNRPELLNGEDAKNRAAQLHDWFWSNKSWEAIANAMRNWMNSEKNSLEEH